jgi:hypothetical protein
MSGWRFVGLPVPAEQSLHPMRLRLCRTESTDQQTGFGNGEMSRRKVELNRRQQKLKLTLAASATNAVIWNPGSERKDARTQWHKGEQVLS